MQRQVDIKMVQHVYALTLSTGLKSGAGSPQPSIVIPTVVATPPLRARPGSLDDLDYSTGDAALSAVPSWSLHHPMKQGVVSAVPLLGALCLAARTLVQPCMPCPQVDSWDMMERFWQQCFFQCAPMPAPEAGVLILREGCCAQLRATLQQLGRQARACCWPWAAAATESEGSPPGSLHACQ